MYLCFPIKACPFPPVTAESSTEVDNVTIYYYGDVATYTCAVGHETITPGDTLTCQADQSWSGAAPTCTRVGTIVFCFVLCALKLTPIHMKQIKHALLYLATDSSTDVVSVTNYAISAECHESVTLGATLTCQADQTCSGTPPTCSRLGKALSFIKHRGLTCRYWKISVHLAKLTQDYVLT